MALLNGNSGQSGPILGSADVGDHISSQISGTQSFPVYGRGRYVFEEMVSDIVHCGFSEVMRVPLGKRTLVAFFSKTNGDAIIVNAFDSMSFDGSYSFVVLGSRDDSFAAPSRDNPKYFAQNVHKGREGFRYDFVIREWSPEVMHAVGSDSENPPVRSGHFGINYQLLEAICMPGEGFSADIPSGSAQGVMMRAFAMMSVISAAKECECIPIRAAFAPYTKGDEAVFAAFRAMTRFSKGISEKDLFSAAELVNSRASDYGFEKTPSVLGGLVRAHARNFGPESAVGRFSRYRGGVVDTALLMEQNRAMKRPHSALFCASKILFGMDAEACSQSCGKIAKAFGISQEDLAAITVSRVAEWSYAAAFRYEDGVPVVSSFISSFITFGYPEKVIAAGFTRGMTRAVSMKGKKYLDWFMDGMDEAGCLSQGACAQCREDIAAGNMPTDEFAMEEQKDEESAQSSGGAAGAVASLADKLPGGLGSMLPFGKKGNGEDVGSDSGKAISGDGKGAIAGMLSDGLPSLKNMTKSGKSSSSGASAAAGAAASKGKEMLEGGLSSLKGMTKTGADGKIDAKATAEEAMNKGKEFFKSLGGMFGKKSASSDGDGESTSSVVEKKGADTESSDDSGSEES